MKALAVIGVLMLWLSQASAEHAEYEKQVAEKFHYATQLRLQKMDQALLQDILDSAPPEEIPWSEALDEIENHYDLRPEGYTDHMFEEVGARATLRASLEFDYRRYDALGTAPGLGELHFEAMTTTAEQLVQWWLKTRSDDMRLRCSHYTGELSELVIDIRFAIACGMPPERVAERALDILRTQLKGKNKADIRYLVELPFMRQLVSALKHVEKEGVWPDDVAPRQ